MTTYLGKSCSFCLPRVPFVNCRQFMYLVISLLVMRAGYGIWLYQFLIIAYLFTLQYFMQNVFFFNCMYFMWALTLMHCLLEGSAEHLYQHMVYAFCAFPEMFYAWIVKKRVLQNCLNHYFAESRSKHQQTVYCFIGINAMVSSTL